MRCPTPLPTPKLRPPKNNGFRNFRRIGLPHPSENQHPRLPQTQAQFQPHLPQTHQLHQTLRVTKHHVSSLLSPGRVRKLLLGIGPLGLIWPQRFAKRLVAPWPRMAPTRRRARPRPRRWPKRSARARGVDPGACLKRRASRPNQPTNQPSKQASKQQIDQLKLKPNEIKQSIQSIHQPTNLSFYHSTNQPTNQNQTKPNQHQSNEINQFVK